MKSVMLDKLSYAKDCAPKTWHEVPIEVALSNQQAVMMKWRRNHFVARVSSAEKSRLGASSASASRMSINTHVPNT